MKNNTAIFELMQNALKVKATPGISYELTNLKKHETQTIYLGYTDYTKQVAVSSKSIYDLASLTKVVAITSRILQLLAKNKINLNTKVSDILSNIAYPQVTIQNLLLHNSGLPADLDNIFSFNSKQEVIDSIKKQSLVYPTGTNMIYSDLNFVLLGLIIEKIDRISLDLSIQKNLIEPLGLKSTGYLLQTKLNINYFVPTELTEERGLVQGSVHDETAYKLNGISGNAGLFSTLNDLAIICKMYLNYGNYNGKIIIPSEMINTLFNYNFKGRTLGWKRWNLDSKTLWHTGFTGTSIALDFDNNSYFICLTNRINPTRDNKKWITIRRKAIKLFFNKNEKLPI